MQGYGPTVVSPNTIYTYPLPQDTVRAYVNNDTPYDILVCVGVGSPSISNGIDPPWQGIIPANRDGYIPANLGISCNLYLQPLDSRQPNLALAGTISNVKNLWVMALNSSDDKFVVNSAIRSGDASSQQRVITLPTAPTIVTGQASFTNNSNVQIYNTGAITVNNVNPIGSKNAAYCFGLWLSASLGAAAAWDVLLQAAFFDGVSTERGQVTIWRGLWVVPANTPSVLAIIPAAPLAALLTNTNGDPLVAFYLKNNSGTAGPLTVDYTAQLWVDQRNQSAPTPYGQAYSTYNNNSGGPY